jgi:hypothetical protein
MPISPPAVAASAAMCSAAAAAPWRTPFSPLSDLNAFLLRLLGEVPFRHLFGARRTKVFKWIA